MAIALLLLTTSFLLRLRIKLNRARLNRVQQELQWREKRVKRREEKRKGDDDYDDDDCVTAAALLN